MQLRLPIPLLAGASFKQGTSAFLTGLTAVGTITAVVINANIGKENIVSILEPLKNTPLVKALLNGLSNLGDKFHNWGSVIVGSKDAFAEWIKQYLNPDGLKAGVAQLYEKLRDWTLIVYHWFRDKFWEFIKNIPAMVRDWDKLRLSLFKWGTFLGGGGGSALWAMFGSGANLGKLAELMGNEEFKEAISKFAELVDQNPEAIGEMGEERMKDILEKFMEDPKDAKEIAEQLLKDQNEKNKDKKEEEKEEIKAEEMHEAFAQPKGSPKTEGQVLGQLMGKALEGLTKLSSSVERALEFEATKAMNEYMKTIEEKAQKQTKLGRTHKSFLDKIKDKKPILVRELSKVAEAAFHKAEKENNGSVNFDKLKIAFEAEMKSKFTVPIREGQEGEAKPVQLDDIVQKPSK